MAQLQSLADTPNTLREYETIYILNPDTLNDKVAEVNDRVKTLIEERGGQILGVDNWGKRKLAYEIQKERKGIYLFWQYLGTPDIVDEFERNMRMIDPVMRYMTIKLDTNVASGSRESTIDGETFEKAAATAADEEEIMMKRSTAEAAAAAAEGSTETAAEGEAPAKADAAEGDAPAKAAAAEGDAPAKVDAAEGDAPAKVDAAEGENAEAPAAAETATDGEEK